MKSFKSIIALVLCAVMLVGIVPMAFKNNEVAAAEVPTVETAETGVIQGSNDLVILWDDPYAGEDTSKTDTPYILAAYLAQLVATTTNGSSSISGVGTHDRVIIVWGQDAHLSFQKDSSSTPNYVKLYAGANSGKENFVWTQKCTITNKDLVYRMTKAASSTKYRTNATFTKLAATNVPDLYNFYDGENKCTLNMPGAALVRMTMGFNMEWNYLNVHFPAKNFLMYCQGTNFTVGANVNFTYGGTESSYRPIVINGSYDDAKSFINNEQTVTLLSGEYQYVAPRTREIGTSNTISGKEIKIVIGDGVVFTKNATNDPNMSALLAFENFEDCNIEFDIGAAVFEGPLYVLGGLQIASGATHDGNKVTDCDVIVKINGATFKNGIVAVMPSASTIVPYASVSGLKLDFIIDDITLGDGKTVQAEAEPYKSGISSTLSYNPANVNVNNLVDFDVAGIIQAGTCVGEHKPAYAVVEGEAAYICSKCYAEVEDVEYKEGYPVVYVGSTGSASNDGVTADTPVSKIWQAFEILANWNMGGYIQLVANVTETAEHTLSTSSGTKWVNCGDLVIIDGAHGDVAASTLTCTSGQIHIFNDVEMRNIKLAAVSGHKAFALNYYNFKAVDNCTMVNPDSYYYSLMLGSTNGFGTVPDNATDRVVDQVVEIDGFSFLFISSGSKSFSLSGGKFSFSRDYSIRCSGTSKVYIGANSRVDAINVRVNNYDDNGNLNASYTAPDTTFYINKAAVDIDNVQFVQNCTSGAPTATVSGGKFTEAGFNIYCDDVTVLPRMINIVDEDAMTLDTLGYNAAGAAVRAGFKDADSFLNGDNVAEFGVLFATAENAGNIAYVSTISGAVNGVAKSRCYDKVADIHNYNYDGTNPVVFRGVLYYEDAEGNSLIDTYGDAEFVAAPYAVINVAATSTANSVAASYTVVGATTDAFSYNGLAK